MSCFGTLRNDGLRGLGQGRPSVAGGTGFVCLCLPALTLLLSAVPRAPLASPESHVETGVFGEGRGVWGAAAGFPRGEGGGLRPRLSCQASDGNRSRKISGLFLIAAFLPGGSPVCICPGVGSGRRVLASLSRRRRVPGVLKMGASRGGIFVNHFAMTWSIFSENWSVTITDVLCEHIIALL